MNDMTRQTSAARLSEDIGDVLSAIRRLIAEDEALTAARDQREEERVRAAEVEAPAAPVAVGGDALASRYGGNAALARRMAQSVQAARRPQPVDEAPGETGEARAARRFDRLEPARISTLIDEPEAMGALTIDAPEPALAPLHPFEAAFLGQDDDEVYELWLDEPAETVAEGAPAADTAVEQTATPPAAATDDVYELWLEPLEAAAEPAEAGSRPGAAEAQPLRLSEADRIIASTPAAGHETAAELNRMLAWRPWTPAAPAAGLTLDIAGLPDEDDEDFAAAFDARIGPAIAPQAARDPEPAQVTMPDQGEPASAAVAPETTLAAQPPQPEVALEPLAPMPESLLRPRTSRWARIEPPVTRERRRPAPMAMATMTPATSQPGALSQRGAIPVAAEPAAPAPVDMVMAAVSAVPAMVVPGEPMTALEQTLSLAAQSPIYADDAPVAALSEAPVALAAEAGATQVETEAPAAETAAAEAKAAEPAETAAASGNPMNDAENEALVREVIREMIQEELHGELGQRFARNLRAVIRREVAAAIEDQFDRV